MALRFDNRVVVITGAGGGLGRAYALQFGARGAKVVVNDLGSSVSGEGKSTKAADVVVEEIRKLGGEAVANYDSVEFGDKIIKTAIDKWGRVDIVINNAGVLRDVSFIKMKEADWDIIYKVHLYGAYSVTKAAWNIMREQGFGRVIMTASAAGLYGNFGQANYSAMKLALMGFAQSLAREGEKRNVFVNTIAPLAGTRMTETVMPPDLVAALKPEYVAPLVLYLCHESCKVNGQVRFHRTRGHFFPLDGTFTPEAVRDNWSKITDWSDYTVPQNPQDAFGPITQNLERAKAAASAAPAPAPSKPKGENWVDLKTALVHTVPPAKFSYTHKDVALYALSVGVARNPLCENQLSYVYENAAEFRVMPTIAVTFPFNVMGQMVTSNPGLSFNPMMLLHGEQQLVIKKPIPPAATLVNHPRIAAIYDKGKAALVVVEVTTKDEAGETYFINTSSLFIRGLGGFGGERGPAQENLEPPARAPDAVQTDKTDPNQALFYRWTSGDLNPLHCDPSMAAIGGFDRPILHGLCTFGFAGKAVLQHFAKWDAKRFRGIRARFAKSVFPGETIVTEMWKVSPTRILFRCKVAERNEIVLTGGAVDLAEGPGDAAAPASAPAASGEFKSAAIFANLEKKVAAAGTEPVQKIKGIYRFDITGANGQVRTWAVDLKTGPTGKVIDGVPPSSDVTLSLSDEDCVELFTGKLNPQQAFLNKKLRIKGDMGLAMKLGQLIGPNAKL